MTNTQNLIRIALIFIISIVAQLFIFNNLQFFGFINPYIYILIVMTLPLGASTGTIMTIGFVAGLIIDMFCNTPGMHAGAMVLASFLRQYILKFIALHNDYELDVMPDLHTYDTAWYLKYATLMVTVHHVTLFSLEQFDTLFFWPTLLRIILSILFTLVFIVLIQMLIPIGSKNKRV
ncbi:MAG: hypothetical protein E7069_10270 [Bacteroidales bacterium]|nr:hypothetical protein [Bacteroidales bacterium]